MNNSRKKHLDKPRDLPKSKITSNTLGNELKVVNDYLQGQRSFALGICINAGSRDDLPGKSGIAHYMEHMLFKRTKNRTGRQISTQFEHLGAYFNAYTTKELTCYYIRALNEHFDKALEILSDVVINPKFNLDDMRSEKSVIIEEIRSYEDDPEESIFDKADEQMFLGNQLANPIAGYEKELKSIKQEDLEQFHKQQYVPSNITLAISGSITDEIIYRSANKYLTEFDSTELISNRKIPLQIKPTRQELETSFSQTHLLYSVRTQGLSGDDKYALSVMNLLFGEGMSSKLNLALREKHGLAYNVYSNLHLLADVGQFMVYAATDPKKDDKLEKLLINEITKLQDKKITNPEITRAKEQLKTGMLIDLESLSNRMQNISKNEIFFGKHDDPESTIELIDQVNKNDMIKLVDNYFQIGNWFVTKFKPGE